MTRYKNVLASSTSFFFLLSLLNEFSCAHKFNVNSSNSNQSSSSDSVNHQKFIRLTDSTIYILKPNPVPKQDTLSRAIRAGYYKSELYYAREILNNTHKK